MKDIASLLKWLIISVLVFGMAFAVYVAVKLNQPTTAASHPQDFEIGKGEHAGLVVDRLAASELIRSELLMEVYLRFKDAEKSLQAGSYSLDSNMTIPEIVQILSQGKVKATGVRFTVVEGWRLPEIAAGLSSQAIMEAGEFLKLGPAVFAGDFEFLTGTKSLEGFLFPDTYLVAKEAGAEAVARKMLENFDKKLTSEIREEISRQKKSLYETIIMASIVEREVGRSLKKGTKLSDAEFEKVKQERRLVAGVFYNRLSAGMPLDSDATLAYVTGSKSNRSTFEELKIDSAYNTYKYRGLPPTPVGNPSLDSILAAISPAKTDYYFFLSGSDGTAYFARTLQEHNQNRERYLE